MQLTRREFMGSSLALGAVSAMPGLSASETPSFSRPGVVVKIIQPDVLNEDGTVNPSVMSQMIHAGITTLTETQTEKSAWSKLIPSRQTVSFKINLLGSSQLSKPHKDHFTADYQLMAGSLSSAGYAPSDYFVWDMKERDGKAIQLKHNQKDSKGILGKIAGLDEYDEPVLLGSKQTRLSTLLTQKTSALINICQAKNHRISGVTGAMKNHYGSINNPWDFHDNHCSNPGLAELNALPQIKNKTRLIMMDALHLCIEGGPQWRQQWMRQHNALLFGTDPVAIDRVLLSMIDAERQKADLAPEAPKTGYIEAAGKMGLGEFHLEKIKLIEKKI